MSDGARFRRYAGPAAIAAIFVAVGIGSRTLTPNAPRPVVAMAARAEHVAAAPPPRAFEIDFAPAYFALDPSAPVDMVARAQFNPADAYGGLPQTEGFDLVAAYCSACHSLRLVMQQGQDSAGWEAIIAKMTAVNGMAAPGAEDQRIIAGYLAREFPAAP